MGKKSLAVFLVSCIFLSIGWVSCKKDESVATPFTRVLGKWKKVRFATDDNANGVLDEYEIRDVAAGTVNTIEFKKDSTGIEKATYSPDMKFRWLVGGDISLMTIYSTGDSIAYRVVQVSSANLYLTTKTTKGLAGYYYDKTK